MTDTISILNEEKIVVAAYKNWKGVVSERRFMPFEIFFGTTEWHPEPQWLLRALDMDKQEVRFFALKDFSNWRAEHAA